MKTILVVNGPNLALLGQREVDKYGTKTLLDLENELRESAKGRANLIFFQSDSEGEIVSFIGKRCKDCDGVVINAAAYSHTSIAVLDALASAGKPYVEVHITNVYAREPFRHRSLLSSKALGVVAGLGFDGYRYGLDYLLKLP